MKGKPQDASLSCRGWGGGGVLPAVDSPGADIRLQFRGGVKVRKSQGDLSDHGGAPKRERAPLPPAQVTGVAKMQVGLPPSVLSPHRSPTHADPMPLTPCTGPGANKAPRPQERPGALLALPSPVLACLLCGQEVWVSQA